MTEEKYLEIIFMCVCMLIFHLENLKQYISHVVWLCLIKTLGTSLNFIYYTFEDNENYRKLMGSMKPLGDTKRWA